MDAVRRTPTTETQGTLYQTKAIEFFDELTSKHCSDVPEVYLLQGVLLDSMGHLPEAFTAHEREYRTLLVRLDKAVDPAPTAEALLDCVQSLFRLHRQLPSDPIRARRLKSLIASVKGRFDKLSEQRKLLEETATRWAAVEAGAE